MSRQPTEVTEQIDRLVSRLPECADKARLRGIVAVMRHGPLDGDQPLMSRDQALIERLHRIALGWHEDEPITRLLHALSELLDGALVVDSSSLLASTTASDSGA